MGYKEQAVEKAIVIGQSPTSQNLVGGVAGLAGGGYAIYEFMHADKLNKAWDNIIADWEQIKVVLQDYIATVNELIVIFNYAYVNGILPDETLVTTLMNHISDLEVQIDDLVKDMAKNTDNAQDAAQTGVWAAIEGFLKTVSPTLGFWKYTVVGLGAFYVFKSVGGVTTVVAAGKGIYKMWEKIRNDHNDKGQGGGTSVTCNVCQEPITAPTTEYLKLELQRHLMTRHVVNVAVAVSVVPSLVQVLSQMPAWAQKSLALEIGVRPEYVLDTREWAKSYQEDWRTIISTLGVMIIAGVAVYRVAAWLPELGAAANVMRPAFALATV